MPYSHRREAAACAARCAVATALRVRVRAIIGLHGDQDTGVSVTRRTMMRRWRPARVRGLALAGPLSLRVLGAAAAGVAAVLTAVSFAVYGGEMGPHIIATVIAVLGEAALVVLVLDRVAKAQERKDWHFVEAVVCQGIAACMVDVVRLCAVRWNPLAFQVNIGRYYEFLETLRLHVADLRSNLEGLALGAEPHVYQQARLIERRVAWISSHLSPAPDRPAPDPEYAMVADTIRIAGHLLEKSASSGFTPDIRNARSLATELGALDPFNGIQSADDRFWTFRLRIQDAVLRQSARERGIWYDIDQELATVYFAIDYVLFEQISSLKSNLL
jgi:hypothetical protein